MFSSIHLLFQVSEPKVTAYDQHREFVEVNQAAYVKIREATDHAEAERFFTLICTQ